MKKNFLLLILGLLSQTVLAHREKSYYLQGKIGESFVGVRIDEYESDSYIRIFNIGELTEKVLPGKIDANSWFEFSTDTNAGGHNFEYIRIHELEGHRWEGEYMDATNISKKIVLSPIIMENLRHPFLEVIKKYEIDPYTALRTKDLEFAPVSEQKISKKGTINWVEDNLAHITFFRIADYPNGSPSLDSINQLLIAKHLKYILEAFTCNDGQGRENFKASFEVHLLNAALLSFTATIGTDCFNTGMSYVNYNETYRIDTAKEVHLEELLYMGPPPLESLKEGSREWTQYRYTVFGPQVLSLLKGLYPQKMETTAADDCDYADVSGWQFPSWHLSPQGLWLGNKSPMLSYNCHEPKWAVLPWKYIKVNLINSDWIN